MTHLGIVQRLKSKGRSSRLKAELLEGDVFLNVDDARTELFDYVEIYYNRQGRLCGKKASLRRPGSR